MTRKRLMIGGALSLVLLTTACAGGDSSAEKVRLTEVIRSIFYAPQYVALEQGYFKQEGLDVVLDTAWGGDKATTKLLAGQADIALVGAETTIYVEQQGAPDALVSFAQVTQRDGTFLVSRRKFDTWDWSQLKGKSVIGSRKGSMPEMVGEYVYRKNGVVPFTDVDIIQNITFDNQATAFTSGTGDFFQAFEPNASILEKAGQGHVVASLGKDSGKLPYTVFMARSSYLKSHPEAVQKFTNAVQKAQTFLADAPAAEVAKVIAPFFDGVDGDILTRVVERYKEADAWAQDPVIEKEEFEQMKLVMQEAGELKADVPYEKVVDAVHALKAKDQPR